MALVKLGQLTTRLASRTLSQSSSRLLITQQKNYLSSKVKASDYDDDVENDKPIPYSSSPAAEWQAKWSQAGHKDDSPWFEPLVAGISSMIFLIYFLYLREANDIDQIFDRELGDYFPDDEIEKIKVLVAGNEYQNLKTKKN
ncbi:hypothetical protein HCN44_005859 [Aphidius gifuensis]|uniref:Uncharacterized protein n=1 Tax=Aphidius gifuensis TaxID=684658 RepID=A0A835CTA3_APHGI|nr:uncharacterized protein LOC122852923 [Aphidius gifuensis]KAF7993078.1 hypothetical protein HCN44_005859 [Aphidius gifuensis]